MADPARVRARGGVALAMVVLRCRRRGVSPALSAAAAIVCALAMIQSFGARAQVLGWMWLDDRRVAAGGRGPWAWAAVPATAVGEPARERVLAPAVAGLFAFAALLRDRRWSGEVGRRAALAAACGAATLATPLGLDLPRYAAGLLA